MSAGARHEVRAWLSRDTYDRLSREAAARHGTLSHTVRACLDEYFVLKQEIAAALTPAPSQDGGTGEGIRLAHALLDDNARRIVAEIARRDERLEALFDHVRLLACMVDQAYFGLVGRLPDVEPGLRAARAAVAEESTRRWRRTVTALYGKGGPALIDETGRPRDASAIRQEADADNRALSSRKVFGDGEAR